MQCVVHTLQAHQTPWACSLKIPCLCSAKVAERQCMAEALLDQEQETARRDADVKVAQATVAYELWDSNIIGNKNETLRNHNKTLG